MISVLFLMLRRDLIILEVYRGGIVAATIIFIEWTGKVTPKSRNGSKVYMEIQPVVPGQEGDFYRP
jgi:hypothetical protein